MNGFNDNGERHGYWELRTINLNYLNGLRDGYYESFWDDKKLSKFSRGYYHMDKSIGYWEWFSRKNELMIKQFHL